MIRLRRFNARCYMCNIPDNDFRVKKKVSKTYNLESKFSRRNIHWNASGQGDKFHGLDRF
jgi:hypothetical protein